MIGWKKCKLGDVIIKTVDNRGKNPPYSPIGYEVIETSCISSKNKYPDYLLVTKFVSEECYNTWFRSGHPLKNDVIIITVGNGIGSVCIMNENRGVLTQNLVGLRINQILAEPNFIYYYLSWTPIQDYLKGLDIGSAQPSIKVPHLLNTDIPLPPLPIQKRIAHILGTLDDKIELNRKMNETLETMARAIFKSWFVDFDPVKAKMEGKQPFGMDSQTASLFPDSFQDSPLGKIPKGWKIEPLDKSANFLNGLALQKYPPNNDNFLPVIKIAELRTGNTKDSDKASSDIPTEYIVNDGDILFSWSGSLMIIIWCGGKGALNQHLFKVTSNDYPKWFYYHWIKHYLLDFQATAASKATTMGHIQRHHLSSTLVMIPADNLLKYMDMIMSPILNKLIINNLESRNLSIIRDTLLQKLLTGEIAI
jgi:type I restriction enzyme, S subunit